jgi:cellulose biosynthesis protein BcsQ/Tfp pilus assembly protein PilF
MESKEPGQIITFYSYKGGTGRSMALANIAWVLASNQKRVLVIDWDLEAPGLHRYFYPFLVDKDLSSSEGLIDFVYEFAVEAATHKDEKDDKDWYKPFAHILNYAVSLEWDFGRGTLDFIPAGRQGPSYSTRVNSFNWQHFYDQIGGGALLEYVKESLRDEYDFILIDSRTGVSDTAGICTVQMPDALVVCFTLNNQSIDGASSVAESVVKQREKSGGIRIFPVPTRIENAEKDKRDLRLKYAQLRFCKFPNTITDVSLKNTYWSAVGVIYIPYYAYEEILAPFGDTPDSPLTLIPSSEKLAGYLTDNTNNKVTQLNIESVRRREEILAQYAELARIMQGSELEQIRAAEKLYSSFSPDRQEATRRLMTRLVQLNRPGDNGQDTSAQISTADLDQWSCEVVQAFSQAQLIRKEREGQKDEVAQLASDALIKGWSKLHSWIEVDREVLLWRQSIQPFLRDWKRGNNTDALRSLQLADVERWLSYPRADLNKTETEFVKASFELQKQELLDAAETLCRGLAPEGQGAVRRALMRMVRVARAISESEYQRSLVSSGDTRAQVYLNDFDPPAREAVQQLVEARLVLRSVDNDTSEELVTLAHGFLLAEWSRLGEWIERDRPFLIWRQEMRASLAEWRRSRRDEGLLMREGKLAEAEDWLAKHSDDLNPSEQEYIHASLDLQEREQSKAAERVFALLTAQEQESARRVLTSMVRVGDSETDMDETRLPLPTKNLDPLDHHVLMTFAGAGLVTIDEESVEKLAQFTKESLLKRWTRLSDWISEDRAFILWRQELRSMTAAWEDTGRSEDALLRDLELVQAENWVSWRHHDLTPTEYEYIVESRAAQASIEKLYNLFNQEEQAATRRALTRMVRLDQSQDFSKDRALSVRLDDLDPSSVKVLKKLSEAGIVSITRNKLTKQDIAELVDESVLTRWPRLKSWIKEEREFLLWRQELRVNIFAWENSSKDKNDLLAGSSLRAGKRWLKVRAEDLNEREKEYLAKGIGLYTKRRILSGAVPMMLLLAITFIVIDQKSHNPTPPKPAMEALAAKLNYEGGLAISSGDIQAAIEKYTEAVAIAPKFKESYFNRGDVYLKMKDYDNAIRDFTHAIELKPASGDLHAQDAESYYKRGLSYSWKKDYDLAIADYIKAIELNPELGDPYLFLGNAYMIKGDKEKAQASFQKAFLVSADLNTRDAAQVALRDLGKSPERNPATVLIHYSDPDDKTIVMDLLDRLKRRKYNVQGARLVTQETSGDVRYFYAEDQSDAASVEKIVEYSLKLKGIYLDIKNLSLVGRYPSVVHGTVEVWLPPLQTPSPSALK